MSKHTPGPWVAKDDGFGPYIMAGEIDIAMAVGPFSYDYMELEVNANARLIAAAPDLLKALQAYDAWADKTPPANKELKALREQMRAAIAKVEGDKSG